MSPYLERILRSQGTSTLSSLHQQWGCICCTELVTPILLRLMGVLLQIIWPGLDVQLMAKELRFFSAQREMVQLETQSVQSVHKLN